MNQELLKLENNWTKEIKEIINYDGELVFDKSKPDGNPRKLLDTSYLTSSGWSPKTDLKEGLVSTYDWFQKNNN